MIVLQSRHYLVRLRILLCTPYSFTDSLHVVILVNAKQQAWACILERYALEGRQKVFSSSKEQELLGKARI